MTSLRKRYLLYAGLMLLGGALLAVTGCGKKSGANNAANSSMPPPTDPNAEKKHPTIPIAPPGKNELTGKITHKGQPIVAGRLFFLHKDGIVMMQGTITRDGTYRAVGLPEGDVRICVLLDPQGEMPFPAPMMPRSRPGGPMGPDGGDPQGGPPGGMPRRGRRPGGPPGAPGPEGGPPTLPPTVVRRMKEFKVPADKQELYKELHEKYGRLTEDNVIKTAIKEGTNTFDIDLP